MTPARGKAASEGADGGEAGNELIAIRTPLAPDAAPRVTVLFPGHLSYDKYQPEWGQRAACSTVTFIKAAGRTILVDTGLDDARLLAGLAAAGVDPATVDTVVLTHAHGDHFRSVHLLPNARVLASGPEVNSWRSRGAPDKELLARLVPTVTGIAPGVRLLLTPGHTPGSASVLVAQAGQLIATAVGAADRDFALPPPLGVTPAHDRVRSGS